MYTTQDRPLPDGTFVRAEFGERANGKQDPYFSVTGTVVKRKDSTRDCDIIACGQLHGDIGEAFPELQPLIKWHLCTAGIPMHYLPNAKHWHDTANGKVEYKTEPDPREVYIRHCVPLDDEDRMQLEDSLAWTWEAAHHLLRQRADRLREAYAAVRETLPQLAEALCAVKPERLTVDHKRMVGL